MQEAYSAELRDTLTISITNANNFMHMCQVIIAMRPSARHKILGLLQEVYNAEQLDILAICFTCVKVLYVGGAIERARRLVALIEPARQAFKTPMHQTVIRNEAAFHGCIQQLLQQPPPSLPSAPSNDVPIIYLCGDSHCLPGAIPAGAVMQLYIGKAAAYDSIY